MEAYSYKSHNKRHHSENLLTAFAVFRCGGRYMALRMKYIFIFLSVLSVSCSKEVEVTKVTIYSPEFQLVRVLESEIELDRFESLIYGFTPTTELPFASATSSELYKIDIESTNDRFSGRWLYHESGNLARLGKTLKPSYKVNNVQEFENVTGI